LRVFIQVGPQRRLLAVKSPVTKLKFKRLAPDEVKWTRAAGPVDAVC
jgi:hypothetical protein